MNLSHRALGAPVVVWGYGPDVVLFGEIIPGMPLKLRNAWPADVTCDRCRYLSHGLPCGKSAISCQGRGYGH